MGLRAVLISATFLAMGATRSAAGADLPVDLELVLAVDVSGSIDTDTPTSSGAATPAR